MKVLSDIFDTLDLKGVYYFRTDFSSPWAVSVPQYSRAARFHLVIQGSALVSFESGTTAQINAGDIILIPAGRPHVLSCEPTKNPPSLETVLETAGYTGEGVLVIGDGDPSASTQLVCGHFDFRGNAEHPILNALPELLLITGADRAKNVFLDEMMRLLVRTVMNNNLGTEATVKRLSEIIFIELLTTSHGSDDALGTILEGFQDQHIGQAIDKMHNNVDGSWTVGSLAAEVGMSRSRFAERFSELVGMGPMSYLSEWRLQKALALLDETPHSIQTIASQIGYQSPAAFSRAFANKFGQSPKNYRNSHP